MKKIKILIIIISIISIILICAIIFLNKNDENNALNNNSTENQNFNNSIGNNMLNNNTNQNNTVTDNNVTITIPEFEEVKSRDDFYTVKACIDKYISYIVSNNNEAVYSLLDEYYIHQNNITENNIFGVIEKINENQIFTPTKMNYAKIGSIEIYTVYGNIREDKLNERGIEKNFNITVILNKTNKNYSVIPGILNVETSYSLVGNNTINEYNTYTSVNIDNKTMANVYFVNYKTEILNNLQSAYNLLDNEYKEKRFNNYSKFEQYIKNNIEKINRANLAKYSVNTYNNYTIYTCIDQYNNYYVFKESAIMQYTAMLDDYTIDTDEFVKTYNSSTVKEKVELNIKKFIKMINNKDYESAYNVLSDGFKNNYFPALNEFENYISNTFYNFNDVTFDTFSTEGEIGIYKVNINGVVNNRDVTMTKTIIMQLDSGTDFKMSFDI